LETGADEEQPTQADPDGMSYPPYPPPDPNNDKEDAPPPSPAYPDQQQYESEPLFEEQRQKDEQERQKQWYAPQTPQYGGGGWQDQYPDYQQQNAYPPQQPYPPSAYIPPGVAPHYNAKPAVAGPSRAGIASIVCFILSIACFIIGTAIVETMGSASTAGAPPQNPEDLTPADIVGVLIVFAAMFLNLLGLVVSFFGFAEKERSKVTVWIGLILNALPCLGCGGIVLLAVVVASAAGI
jgi:hypothetical protein